MIKTKMNKLDLIAVPVMVQGEKLLKHYESIDVPLKRYYILDNSEGKDSSVDEAIDQICDNHKENIDEIAIVSNNQNSGYPGAVNQIIRDNTDCAHWLVSGFDWWAAPKQYKKVLEKLPSLQNGAFLGTGCDSMCGFLFTKKLIRAVGYLDENFFPGYFEDNDYKRRIQVANIQVPTVQLDAEHERSSTLNSSEQFKKRNQFTFQQNFSYYVNKWGGKPNEETYVRPFNQPVGLDYWKFDPERREKSRW